MNKFKKALLVFWSFFKIGLFTFGGGYAMLPMLERELIDNRGWTTNEELMDYFAVAQCTPGVIAVNTATFIGYKLYGNLGGIVATLGVVFPSLVIITTIAGVLTNFADIPAVKHAFAGVRVCVCVLIFNAVLKLMKSSMKDAWGIAIFAVIFVLSILTNLSPVIYVVAAALAGVLIQSLKAGGAKK